MMTRTIEHTTKPRRLRALGMLALPLLAAGLLAACNEAQETTPIPTVEDLSDSPGKFVGKRVTIAGEVDTVHSNQAFELEQITWLFDDEVLVLTPKPVHLGKQPLRDGLLVSVTGALHELAVAEIERELGWDLDPELEVRWKDKYVFVADRVQALQNFAEWSASDDPNGMIMSLWAVHAVRTPLDLEGARITLEAVSVAARSDAGLWVGVGGSPDLYVAPDEGVELPEVEAGKRVQVRGVLERMPPAATAVERFGFDDEERSRAAADALYLRAQALEPVTDDGRSAGARPGASQRDTQG